MDNQTDNEEAQQLVTINIYRKLVQAILLKYKFLLLFIFAASTACVLATMKKLVNMSPFHYTAKTSLIFYPKRTSKIGSMDEHQVLRIFSRRIMQQKLAESMNLGREKGNVSDYSIEIRQEWKQTNLFSIESHSSNKDDAINAVNLMAQICIKEYVAFRIEDLGKWGETVNTRKMELTESIKKIEDQIAELSQTTKIADPEQEFDRIKGVIVQLKNTRSDLQVKLTNAKISKENVELILKNIDTNALLNIEKLRSFHNDIKKVDDEIAKLRETYTDKNPRIIGLIERHNDIVNQYNDFLKEKNIKSFNLETLGKAAEVQSKLMDILINIESINERISVVDAEIKANEELAQKLTSIIPRIMQISHERESLQKALKDLDDDTSSINYLLATVKNDMAQVERCESATAQDPFSVANILLAVIAGLGCMFIAAALVAFIGVIFGNVNDLDELLAYAEINALGAIPSSVHLYETASDDEKTAIGSIFYNFMQVEAPKKVVFLATLPGSNYSNFLKEGLNWNFAMSGKRLLHLKIVRADSFKEPTAPDAKIFGAAYYHGMEGETPADNPRALSQTELSLLQSDIAEMQNDFDTIFITSDEPFDRFGVFFDQMLQLCDSALVLVGARRTPRSLLRYVVSQQHKSGRCIMSILTNSKDSISRKG